MIEPMRALKLILALALMTLLLTSCRGAAGEHAAHTGHPPSSDATAAGPVNGDYSIYDLESSWVDQTGTEAGIRSLEGRPQLIAMVYTHCAYACPRIMADMKRIEAELSGAGVEAGYVLVSIDPQRDTPERLREFAEASRLDPADWTLLTSTDDAVLELAALLGVRYRRVSETDFEHSNIITLVDETGRILYRQTGLGGDASGFVAALTN